MAMNYKMGFAVNGTAIPDPSKFSGAESALDTSGERDATGMLHRAMVATKHPLKIEWNLLEWSMIQRILGLVRGESFQFTYPDPANGLTTIKAYAGDRAWEATLYNPDTGAYHGPLSFSVIEF